jgi:hypothetical protein
MKASVQATVKPMAAQTDHLQSFRKVPFTMRRKKSRMEILIRQVPARKTSWPSQALCMLLVRRHCRQPRECKVSPKQRSDTSEVECPTYGDRACHSSKTSRRRPCMLPAASKKERGTPSPCQLGMHLWSSLPGNSHRPNQNHLLVSSSGASIVMQQGVC